MNKVITGGIFAATISGICLIGSAKADDSIYINLSVLDSLNSAPVSISAPQGPLFPIVKKAPEIKKSKAIKPKIVVKKKIKNKIKSESKVVVKTPTIETVPSHPQIPYVESTDKVEVVSVEPVALRPDAEAIKMPEVVLESIAEGVKTQNAVSEPVVIADVVKSDSIVEKNIIDNQNVDNAPSLLVDEASQLTKPEVVSKLVFSPDVDELSSEQQAQVDSIISSFEDASVNKIAIYAYNLDDGVDAFKRKRLSLNRAVSVRSYLLPKGYKNFSIKVINVDVASGKANTVELEEIKQ